MKQIIIVFALNIAILTGCTSSPKGNADNTSITTEKDNVEDNKDKSEILALLEETEVTIFGVYGKFEKKTDNVIRGNDEDNKREFTGQLKNISDIHTVNENGKILVSIIANIEGQFFKTINPCSIQCTIEKDSDNKLFISSTNLLEDILPDITPTVPFDINYVFEPSGTEPNTISFKLSGKEYDANKELYMIDGTEIVYDAATNGRDAGGTYYITVPLSKEYIQDLGLAYSQTNNCNVIDYHNIIMTVTLKNGLKIHTHPTIRYILSNNFHTLENPADYWEFTDLDYWALDKKEN